jgi:hypothetical protein
MQKSITAGAAAVALTLLVASAGHGQGANPRVLYDRAKQAIAAGNVVPERDLAPLVAVPRAPTSEDGNAELARLGARLTASQAQMVSASATDARSKAIIKRALVK